MLEWLQRDAGGYMSPGLTVCAVPGCPELTEGNFCEQHVDITPEEEAEEILRLERLRKSGGEKDENEDAV